MARQKLSEFRAKTILAAALGQTYTGVLLDASNEWKSGLASLPRDRHYVAKVDEGVKGRFKQGLVKLDLTWAELAPTARELFAKGFRYVLVEPQVIHDNSAERYISIERTRAGRLVLSSQHGGVDVNDAASGMTEQIYTNATASSIASSLGLKSADLAAIMEAFDANYFGFLEINPLVIVGEEPRLLDAAVEVDGEAAPLVAGRWGMADVRSRRTVTAQEAAVLELASRSMSSFRLEVLNPQGQVFLLLSGGGASVTLADEVHNQGFGSALANYGEYSGNPTADETYMYTKQIVSLLLESPKHPKVLVIAGGVANFTDIRVTFSGVIRAIEEVKGQLRDQGIKVYVRRGGPHEAEGLASIESCLREAGLLGLVAGPEMVLTDIVTQALSALKTGAKS